MYAVKNRPRKRRNIPLNLIKPSKQKKRIKVDRVSGTLPQASTVPRIQPGPSVDPSFGDISDDEPDFCGSDNVLDSMQLSGTSSHTKRKEKAAAKWDEIHQTALRVMIEESSLPSGIRCFVCGIKTAVVRCLHCGPQHFFCEKCAMDLHTHALYHHCPELWQVSYKFQ